MDRTKTTRMMHGRELEGVRPIRRSEPITTVDVMAGSGLKYVHATSRGRNGMVGDLERCREKVHYIFGKVRIISISF